MEREATPNNLGRDRECICHQVALCLIPAVDRSGFSHNTRDAVHMAKLSPLSVRSKLSTSGFAGHPGERKSGAPPYHGRSRSPAPGAGWRRVRRTQGPWASVQRAGSLRGGAGQPRGAAPERRHAASRAARRPQRRCGRGGELAVLARHGCGGSCGTTAGPRRKLTLCPIRCDAVPLLPTPTQGAWVSPRRPSAL